MPITFASLPRNPTMERAGFRFGARGTHGSRTIMLRELAELFAAVPPHATRDDYATTIVDQNVLGKATYATRSSSRQRLTEMYGLDPRLAIFRVLRHLWRIDRDGRPLLAMLTALARDPLLRSTASPVLALAPGDELTRSRFASVIRAAVGTRMNDAVLDKVARNAASSWAQAGHLEGRVRKIRRRIDAHARRRRHGSLAGAARRPGGGYPCSIQTGPPCSTPPAAPSFQPRSMPSVSA